MQYIIYCDESEKNGKYYGNFYGGALVRSVDYENVKKALETKKEILNLSGEVKWQKVTANYLDKYLELMDLFFDFIEKDKVKIRIMFTHNMRQASSLTKEQRDNEYFLLYYQFFKHIFGFQYSNPHKIPISLFIYFDQLPDTKEKNAKFKDYIFNLQGQEFLLDNKISIKSFDDIAEAKSHNHVILQCLDVILGAIEFKLNEKHKIIPEGKKRRGKRTVAKEKLYKYINARIREIYPGFNVGESTGISGDLNNRWIHPYRHWKFTSIQSTLNPEYKAKRK